MLRKYIIDKHQHIIDRDLRLSNSPEHPLCPCVMIPMKNTEVLLTRCKRRLLISSNNCVARLHVCETTSKPTWVRPSRSISASSVAPLRSVGLYSISACLASLSELSDVMYSDVWGKSFSKAVIEFSLHSASFCSARCFTVINGATGPCNNYYTWIQSCVKILLAPICRSVITYGGYLSFLKTEDLGF